MSQPFYEQLCVEHFPLLQDLSYAALAPGDSHYEHFCEFGKDLDARLESLDAARIHPRVDCDVDLGEPFTAFKASLLRQLDSLSSGAKSDAAPIVSMNGNHVSSNGHGRLPALPTPSHMRDNPYVSQLVDKRSLTHDISTKQTLHLAFSVAESDLRYEAGDALGWFPGTILTWSMTS